MSMQTNDAWLASLGIATLLFVTFFIQLSEAWVLIVTLVFFSLLACWGPHLSYMRSAGFTIIEVQWEEAARNMSNDREMYARLFKEE